MLMTTTSALETHVITAYLGIVAGEAAIAPVELRDFAAFIKSVGGGRHPEFEKVISETRQTAMMSLESHAKELGANAVIGVDFDYAYLASDGLVMITVSGTAVTVEDKKRL